MVVEQIGEIADGIYLLGHRAVPIFLVDGERPALFDAGMAFLGPLYGDQIRQVLGNRQPAWCFLTHSHFDHCGAVAYLKQLFPTLKVVCSRKAAHVFTRPSAISLIRDLNRSSATMAADLGIAGPTAPFAPFSVDVVAGEGDTYDIASGLTVEILETPGHTWDFLSFYLPQRKLLIASEALGTPDESGYIINDCLVDYDAYCRSMQRLQSLDVEILLLGHIRSYTGRHARQHITASLDQIHRFKGMVEGLLNEENGDLEAVQRRIKAIEWDHNPGMRQPEPAYLLNLAARVQTVMRKNHLPSTSEHRGPYENA